jgi:hypothetical protein
VIGMYGLHQEHSQPTSANATRQDDHCPSKNELQPTPACKQLIRRRHAGSAPVLTSSCRSTCASSVAMRCRIDSSLTPSERLSRAREARPMRSSSDTTYSAASISLHVCTTHSRCVCVCVCVCVRALCSTLIGTNVEGLFTQTAGCWRALSE